MKRSKLTQAQITRRVAAAQGKIPCDLQIQNVRYLDVFSCQWRKGDVSVIDGAIVGLDPGLKATRTIDGKGRWLVPGFIDAHVHIESSLMIPSNFESAVLKKGTTAAVCDPHELANVMGVPGIQYFLDSASSMDLGLYVMLSSCVPATGFETNGGGSLSARDLLPLTSHPKALGLAEVMNFPGVLYGDPELLEKLEAFSGGPMDGHAPLIRGHSLSAYATAGISSCHESSELEEAQEKLTKGISVWIREGSVAKDLDELAPLLNLATSTSIGFCTDDRNPLDIHHEGHVDHLVRQAIRKGISPEIAYRAASWSVARHYGMTRYGAIAPGYAADFILLGDAGSCAIDQVFKRGAPVEELSTKSGQSGHFENSIRAEIPEAKYLEGPDGSVHVMTVIPGKIITGREIAQSDETGIARISVLERYGKGSRPANAYVRGFGNTFRGAIASSVGHDSHNLIAVGDRSDDMRIALAELSNCGGGFCVVKDGNVLARLALPLGGLMSRDSPNEIARSLTELREASRGAGCDLAEPFLQLAFLSLPVIPSLKLTDRGLFDVEKFQLIDVRA